MTDQETTPRIYSYDCRAPIVGKDEFDRQVLLGARYYNDLVALERRRRRAEKRVRDHYPKSPLDQRILLLDVEFAKAAEAIRAKRKGAGRRADIRVEAARKMAIGEALKEARAERKVAREAGDSGRSLPLKAKVRIERIRKAAHNVHLRIRAAYAEGGAGLYWGTYNLEEDAFEQAKSAPLPPPRPGKRLIPFEERPRFRRFDGTGRMGIQCQKGKKPEAVFRLEPVDPATWFSTQGIEGYGTRLPAALPGSKKAKTFAFVYLRARSDEKGHPIWATWPVRIHRSIPDDAIVMRAWMRRSRSGPRWSYELQVTVVEPVAKAPEEIRSRVAVDIGWRRAGGVAGLRAGYFLGSEGDEGEILVPERSVGYLAQADRLRGHRDVHYNVARAYLGQVIEEGGASIPDWFLEATRYAANWRSPGKLVGLLRTWKEWRFDGDEIPYETLRAWERRDLHLWSWEADIRSKARRIRLQDPVRGYRILSARLAERYDELVIEDFDLRRMATHVPDEEGPLTDGREQRRSRIEAAPNELRDALKNAFSRRGKRVDERDPALTTRRHAACGHEEPWDARPHVRHVCANCAVEFDQDRNACENLLASAEVASPGGGPLAPTENGQDPAFPPRLKGRWQRRRSQKQQKAGENNQGNP